MPTSTSVTVVTGATASASAPTFKGTQGSISIDYTPQGNVSQPTFTGKGVQLSGTFAGQSQTLTGKFTPSGSINATFKGTTTTITVQ